MWEIHFEAYTTFDYMRKFYLVSITFPYVEVYTDIRPWGKFEKFHENELCTVKLIYINSNSRLSLQYHQHRWEFWKILKGTAEVELEGAKVSVKEGEHIKIGTGVKHRIKAYEDYIVLEISYGRFDENDITRIEDDYGRVK